jgi:8-oxo-dGTP diphosphatase
MSDFAHPLPSINLTVDVIIFTVSGGSLKVLVIRRQTDPFKGSLALPGGYLQANELAVATAHRVLFDKAGVRPPFVEQLYTFDGLKRDPRGRLVSIVYYALISEASLQLSTGSDAQEPTLMSVSELPDLAFDHAEMIDYAKKRLQSKLEYTNAVFSLLPDRFTYAALQQTYEAILGRGLDKRNFQKKFNSLGLIEATEETTSGGKHRPARLFKFKDSKPTELKKFF